MPIETKIKTKYDYELQASLAPGVKSEDKSLTNQADLVNSDINKIMARYEKTGLVMGTDRPPKFGDFSEVADYHAQLSAIRRVDAAFAALPAEVRNRFENDPAKLMAFIDNPANIKEAVKLGLFDENVYYNKIDPDIPGSKITQEIYDQIINMPPAERLRRQEQIAADAAKQGPTA